jgi:hypothetical protein
VSLTCRTRSGVKAGPCGLIGTPGRDGCGAGSPRNGELTVPRLPGAQGVASKHDVTTLKTRKTLEPLRTRC